MSGSDLKSLLNRLTQVTEMLKKDNFDMDMWMNTIGAWLRARGRIISALAAKSGKKLEDSEKADISATIEAMNKTVADLGVALKPKATGGSKSNDHKSNDRKSNDRKSNDHRSSKSRKSSKHKSKSHKKN